MLKIIQADGTAELEQLRAMRQRAAAVGTEIELTVRGIMENVKEKAKAKTKKEEE